MDVWRRLKGQALEAAWRPARGPGPPVWQLRMMMPPAVPQRSTRLSCARGECTCVGTQILSYSFIGIPGRILTGHLVLRAPVSPVRARNCTSTTMDAGDSGDAEQLLTMLASFVRAPAAPSVKKRAGPGRRLKGWRRRNEDVGYTARFFVARVPIPSWPACARFNRSKTPLP